MQLRTPLPLNPAQQLAQLKQSYSTARTTYEQRLGELKNFYTTEINPAALAADNAFITFETLLNDHFPEPLPASSNPEPKLRQLQIALQLMDDLIRLQKTVAPLKTIGADNPWYLAGCDLWLQGTGLAQHLFNTKVYPANSFYAGGLRNSEIYCFRQTIHAANNVFQTNQSTSDYKAAIQNLTDKAQHMETHLGLRFTPQYQNSRLYDGFMGTLTFLAGLALIALAILISTFVQPFGIGLIAGIPLALVGGLMVGMGITQIAEAFLPRHSVITFSPALTEPQQQLANSANETAQAAKNIVSVAKFGVFSGSVSMQNNRQANATPTQSANTNLTI